MAKGHEDVPSSAARKLLPSDSEWLRTIALISPVGIYRTDADGRCTFANDRWCEMTGHARDATLGKGWDEAIHPDDRDRLRAEWERAAAAGKPLSTECSYVQPSGQIVWVLAQTVEERDAEGRLAGYLVTVTDITELTRMREELERSHAQLEERVRERTLQLDRMAMIVAASDDAIIGADTDAKVVSWNRAAEAILGYSGEEMLGKAADAFIPPERIEEARAIRARVNSGQSVSRIETERLAKNGERIEVSLSLLPLVDAAGRIVGMSGILRDIRERKKAERHLHQLSQRLMQAQDEERRRVARELHDSTAQGLAALAMNLSILSQNDAALGTERRATLLANALELARGAVNDLRTQAYLLHPPLLDERGLYAALQWFIQGFTKRSRIAVEIEMAPDFPRLHQQLELTIFRVIQESLSNVHRHSGCGAAKIRLVREGGSVALEIRDTGRGIPPGGIDEIGVGIAGMRERVLHLGGSFALESNDPGTAVIARLAETL